MTLILSGTDGLSDVDGTAATPAIRGTDANTGIFFPAADTIAFSEGGAEAARFDSSGNLGIGTASTPTGSSAGSRFITAAGSTDGVLQLTKTSATAGGGAIASAGGAGILFYTHTGTVASETYTERMRIDSSGHLMVAGTSANPVATRVNGTTITPTGGVLSRTPSASSYFGLSVTSGVNITFYTDNGSTFVTGGSISTNGGTTSFNGTSDYRLKNNVQPLTNALDRVALLKPVKWTWKEGFEGTQPKGEGFIAHELAEIIPSAVTGEKDAVDEDGNPVYQGLDTRFLVATLTAAIQEQQALITALTARITALESN